MRRSPLAPLSAGSKARLGIAVNAGTVKHQHRSTGPMLHIVDDRLSDPNLHSRQLTTYRP